MAMSATKKLKLKLRLELEERRKKLDERSLNGLGMWMDANHEHYARQYLETGDVSWLNMLPDYRVVRIYDSSY